MLLWHIVPYLMLSPGVLFLTIQKMEEPPVWEADSSYFQASYYLLYVMTFWVAPSISVGIAAGIALFICGWAIFWINFRIFGEGPVGIAVWTAAGIGGGIAYGIAGGITGWLGAGIGAGIGGRVAVTIAVEIATGIAVGIAVGIIGGITVGITSWSASRSSSRIADRIAAAIVFGTAGGIGVGIAFGTAVGIALTRVYYIPLHIPFLWPIPLGRFYRFHPVAWDDLCSFPFPGLHHLLLAYATHAPKAAEQELTRLIDTYPSQRAAALRARTTLLARSMANARLTQIDLIAASLPQGEKSYLAQVPLLRDLIHDIAQQQRRIDTVPRASIREPLARQLCETIQAFGSRVGGFNEPLATEFRTAARTWSIPAEQQWREAKAVSDRQPTQQVFRAGDPVDIGQEAFVPRTAVVGDIAAQLTLATGCPGLILYGRRRTGKSTVLRNLHSFLGPETPVLVLSMQDPGLFTSQDMFAAGIVRAVAGLWPNDPLPQDGPALAGLMAALTQANDRLTREGKRLLITLDEYENIDAKIGEGVFNEDLLHTLRESIQTHRHIVWIFAGSHAIEELPHAPWPSFLVSARTIEVPMFTPEETTLLLTEPMRSSPLWPKDDPSRPRFAPELWGPGGIERIHAETGGWPHLVQLVAETVIDLLNQGTQPNADAALLNRALDKAVVSGDTVLRELVERECGLPGEWDYLRNFRRMDAQAPSADEGIERSLPRRRMIAVDAEGMWRMRVPLMQRWLRERA